MIKLGKHDLKEFFSGRHRFTKGNIIALRMGKNGGNLKRFAFIVSGPKKSAASRNLTRRRLSEIVRTRIGEFPAGWDMVFSVKLGQKKAHDFLELKRDIENVLRKTNF